MPDLDETDPQQLLEEAKALQGRGEHTEAAAVLQRVVEQGGDWEARFRYANSLAIDAQVEKAYEAWREVVALPEWSPSQVQGELAGQFTEAMRHISFETTVDVDDPKSAYLQAKVAQLFDQPDVVKHALIKTLTRRYDYEDTLEWLMRLLGQEGQHEEALKLVEPLLMQAPSSPALTYWAGELNHLTGRTAVAVRILANAVKLDPNRWQAHARLAEIYAGQHRFEEADAAYEAALRLNPDDFDLVMGSVEAAKRQYQFERALTLLEKATQLKPGDQQVQIEFAQLSFQMGAMAKAVPGLELALAASPQDPQLVANLARAYYGTGQFEKAAPMLAKALQSTPDGELAYLWARSLAELKQRPQALEALKKAAELSPDRAQYQASLGKELLSLGQTEDALKALAAAADLEPQNALAQLNVAGLYKKGGQTKAAMDYYIRASAVEPERADVHLQIGVLGLSCDRLEEAANAFIEVLRLSPAPHPMALAGVAQIYQRRGLSEVAVDFYRQALQANPGMTAAAQAVSVIFAKDKDIEGLLVFLKDLLDFFKGRSDDARAMVSAFSTYLESKGLVGFCTEVAALFAERFPSPEADAERARLFMLRAEQLQSKGDAVRAYHILQRLHGFEPRPELTVRLEAMRTALGSALETRPETPPPPAPASGSVLDSVLPPVPAIEPAVGAVETAPTNGVASTQAEVALALVPAMEEPASTQLEADQAEASGGVIATTEQQPEEPVHEQAVNAEAPDSPTPQEPERRGEEPSIEATAVEEAPVEPRAELAQPEPSAQTTEEEATEPVPAADDGPVSVEISPSLQPSQPESNPIAEPEPASAQSVAEPDSQATDVEGTVAIEAEPAPELESPVDPEPAPHFGNTADVEPAPHLEDTAEAEPAPQFESAVEAEPSSQFESLVDPEPASPSENTVEAEPAPLSEPGQDSRATFSSPPETEPASETDPSEAPPLPQVHAEESSSEPPQLESPPEPIEDLAQDTAPEPESATRAETETEDAPPSTFTHPESPLVAPPGPPDASEPAAETPEVELEQAEPFAETGQPENTALSEAEEEPTPETPDVSETESVEQIDPASEASPHDAPSADPIASEPESTDAATPEPESTEAVAPEPASPDPVASEPESTEAVASEPASPDPVASEPESTDAATPEPELAEPVAAELANPQETAEPEAAESPMAQPSPPLLAPPSPTRFVRERLFELRAHSHRPTQQHLWERSLGEYLLASASSRAYKQPRELDEDAADELCDIYLDSAKILRDAGWLEQSCAALSTALLYNPQHHAVLDELEETVLEWVEFLDEEEIYEQALMLLEGQWERRPGDKLRSRARGLFGSWANAMRQEGDHYGAEALEANWSTRMQYWEELRSEWSSRQERSRPPNWT